MVSLAAPAKVRAENVFMYKIFKESTRLEFGPQLDLFGQFDTVL
jgi:hypothetical protein